MIELSVIIVSYNVSHFLQQTLKSVEKALANISGEVIIVDNDSVDGSVEMVRQKFPGCIIITNSSNEGFSKANNRALKIAQGKYVLLLNPDTVVQEDTFYKCIEYMDVHPEAGGLGVYMVDGKGEFLPESKRGLPTPWVAFYKIIGLSKAFPLSKKFGRYHLGFLDKDKIHQIEILSGAYMFLRKSVLDKVGLLDEDYFMYGEDIDLSYRIIKGGFANIYFPETRIIHYKGESTKRSSVNYVLVFYSSMIIFFKKHYSGVYARLFSGLIKSAIYLRAFYSILFRLVNKMAYPFVNAIVIFIGIAFIKNYWENNFRAEPGLYPSYFLTSVIPVYILVWLLSVYYNGGFDKPYKTYRIIRGIFIGTLIISALSNFLDNYRFSKALIILGSIWAFFSIIGVRYLFQFLRFKRFDFEETTLKRIIIVGNAEEAQRVNEIILRSSVKASILGFISYETKDSDEDNYLGKIGNINALIKIYKPDEIIFCSKNIEARNVIELMAQINSRNVDFKIVPDDSNFIIGSSSKNSNGELYTIDVHLAILDQNNIRNKRIIDLTTSLLFLMCSPLFLFFIKHKSVFYKNLLFVLLGKYSMVGFSKDESIKLPKIKKGILSPTTEFQTMTLDAQTIHRLNLIYAKDYKTSIDLNIIFNSITNLDNKVKS